MSRRKGRYERRQTLRLVKKTARNEAVGRLEDVMTFDRMYKAGKQCCKNVRWKQSVQNFERHLLSTTARSRRRILDGKWKWSKCAHFELSERGKTRPIDAPLIQDRHVQKVVTQSVLLPLYQPSMIWNNGASLPGKGFKFSQEELKKELRQHFRKYGREGWALLLDFQKYFPSVPHESVLAQHKKLIMDEELRTFVDSITHAAPESVGLPLGVEPSQAEMIALPSPVDNYVKCQLSLKGVGRYMDDYCILVPPDKDPKEIMRLVTEKAAKLGLTISRHKTRIVPLTRPFKYCKTKYIVTENGRVITNGNRDSVKRARRKIKAFHGKVERGELTYEDLWTSVNGMLAYFENYNDHNRVLKLRRLFYGIFGFSPERIENFRDRDVLARRKSCAMQ